MKSILVQFPKHTKIVLSISFWKLGEPIIRITFSPFSFCSFDKWLDFDIVQSHVANDFIIHIVKSESALIRSFDTNPGFSKRCEIIIPTLFIKLVSMEVNHIVVIDCICFPTHLSKQIYDKHLYFKTFFYKCDQKFASICIKIVKK